MICYLSFDCRFSRLPQIKRQGSHAELITQSPCQTKSKFSWFENAFDGFYVKVYRDKIWSSEQIGEFVWFEDEQEKKFGNLKENLVDCKEEKETDGNIEIRNTMKNIYESNFGLIK